MTYLCSLAGTMKRSLFQAMEIKSPYQIEAQSRGVLLKCIALFGCRMKWKKLNVTWNNYDFECIRNLLVVPGSYK